MKFKTLMSTMLASTLLFATSEASATVYTFTNSVHKLSTTDPSMDTDGGSSLRLNSTTYSAGSCWRGSSGYLVMNIRPNAEGERMYTMALAAYLAGHQLEVTVDDTSRNSQGHCHVQRLRIQVN